MDRAGRRLLGSRHSVPASLNILSVRIQHPVQHDGLDTHITFHTSVHEAYIYSGVGEIHGVFFPPCVFLPLPL